MLIQLTRRQHCLSDGMALTNNYLNQWWSSWQWFNIGWVMAWRWQTIIWTNVDSVDKTSALVEWWHGVDKQLLEAMMIQLTIIQHWLSDGMVLTNNYLKKMMIKLSRSQHWFSDGMALTNNYLKQWWSSWQDVSIGWVMAWRWQTITWSNDDPVVKKSALVEWWHGVDKQLLEAMMIQLTIIQHWLSDGMALTNSYL